MKKLTFPIICGALIILGMTIAAESTQMPAVSSDYSPSTQGVHGARELWAEIALAPANENQASDSKEESRHQGTRSRGTPEDSSVARLMRKRGLPAALLAIFIGGIGLTLTPCVFPMIPVVVGWFVLQGGGRRSRTALMAMVFLIGLAGTYAALGLSAAKAGGMLGATLQHPVALIIIAAIFLTLALSMFGLFEIQPPAFISNRSGGRQGALGMLIMGALFGIVAAPCAGPVVAGLLIYVGHLGNPALGFWMLFTLALGLGLPFFVLAVFSGALAALPRAGMWMVAIRHIFGLILIYTALRFLEPIIPKWLSLSFLGAFIIGTGVYLCCFESTLARSRSARWLRPLLGMAVLAAGTASILPQIRINGANSEIKAAVTDFPYSPNVLEEARRKRIPVVLHFSAEWCNPCKKLAAETFVHPAVVAEGKRFIWVKADLTTVNTSEIRGLVRRYGVKGVPTVILIGSDGQEKKRIIGFIGPPQFLRALRHIR